MRIPPRRLFFWSAIGGALFALAFVLWMINASWWVALAFVVAAVAANQVGLRTQKRPATRR